MANKYNILSTKTLPAILHELAEENDAQLRIHGFVEIAPIFISPEFREEINQLIQTCNVTVFTSANAVLSIKGVTAPTQVCCLSGNTLETVQKIFPKATIVATADHAAELAHQMIATRNIHSAVFFCGNKRRDTLPDLLQQHQIDLKEVVVYETIPVPVPIEGHIDGVLFFSPSGVESYFHYNQLAPDTVCFAIGQTTGDALKAYTSQVVVMNEEKPSAKNLLQLAITYFKNHN
ncbi:MAG: Uroporphyrinogen synthase [Bacteroidetes bacterium]|uniref:uroporphyrinogen-III synthase n=1 Tax=unclassified Chitinophaga TaxID=2619133 RepID=UPI0009C4B41D|nr:MULTISPECIES: uroporphyrinogen-III synthase [unclassified Chitinophaga]MBP1651417.1 Uroporphyrinogen synthase [Bacteroidota bacterium]OMP80224.1 hypothetical protein BW716_05320 [[Flexibacter] sp. ATCC 35208]WPV66783.1 uroporphyrinogen-III synthase [Chitinophaga sp. LS1]